MRASLSVRTAWIEIAELINVSEITMSLSVRTAWIEILDAKLKSPFVAVAVRKDSVD